MNCASCGQPLADAGLQQNCIKGTEFDLRHCLNESCPEFMFTRAYDHRPMDPTEAQRQRELLLAGIAKAAA